MSAGRTGLRRLGSWLHLLFLGALMLAIWLLLIWVGSRPALKGLIDLSPQLRPVVAGSVEERLSFLSRVLCQCFEE